MKKVIILAAFFTISNAALNLIDRARLIFNPESSHILQHYAAQGIVPIPNNGYCTCSRGPVIPYRSFRKRSIEEHELSNHEFSVDPKRDIETFEPSQSPPRDNKIPVHSFREDSTTRAKAPSSYTNTLRTLGEDPNRLITNKALNQFPDTNSFSPRRRSTGINVCPCPADMYPQNQRLGILHRLHEIFNIRKLFEGLFQ